MQRRLAIQIMSGALFGATLTYQRGLRMLDQFLSKTTTPTMPLLFIGHGSPMNAIETNHYTKVLSNLGSVLDRPRVILVISAHWTTLGTKVTAMPWPKTIHDFYGFPSSLFEVKYPAPGSPELANQLAQQISTPQIQLDTEQWGLDHGTWSVLKHLYPAANIPVVQLSIDLQQPPAYHFQLGQQLNQWRRQGVLVIGSGNLVHNLQRVSWEPTAMPFDWAVEFDQWVKSKLLSRDFNSLMKDFYQTSAGRLSHPTTEHYYPLFYILGAAQSQDELHFEFEDIQNASIAMRSFRLG